MSNRRLGSLCEDYARLRREIEERQAQVDAIHKTLFDAVGEGETHRVLCGEGLRQSVVYIFHDGRELTLDAYEVQPSYVAEWPAEDAGPGLSVADIDEEAA